MNFYNMHIFIIVSENNIGYIYNLHFFLIADEC